MNAKALIQRFPASLLPLLSIKAAETPPYLDDTVQGGLDLMACYLAERLEVVRSSQSGVTNPTTLTLTVPANESWYLYNVSVAAANVTAGSVVSLAAGIGDAAGVNSYIAATPLTAATIATQAVVLGVTQSLPILLKPGMRIVGQLLADPGAGTVDLDVSALIARLTSN